MFALINFQGWNKIKMYSVTIYLSSTLMLMMNSPSCFNNLAAFPLEHKFVTMHIMNIILCIITLYFTLHRFCRLSRLKSVQQMIYLRRFLPRLCFHSLVLLSLSRFFVESLNVSNQSCIPEELSSPKSSICRQKLPIKQLK